MIPRNPLDVLAQQIVAICADEEVAVDDLHDARPRRVSVLRPLARPARERARHACRPLPVRRVRRAATAHHLGSHGRHDPRRGRRAPAGGDERGHDPRPRALRRPPRRRRTARSASSTRRWCTRRGRGRRSCSAPRAGASRRSRATACSSRRRPAYPARCRSGRARASGRPFELGQAIGARVARAGRALRRGSARAAARPSTTSTRSRPRNLAHVPPRAGERNRRRARPIAPSSSSASATRSATGASAC